MLREQVAELERRLKGSDIGQGGEMGPPNEGLSASKTASLDDVSTVARETPNGVAEDAPQRCEDKVDVGVDVGREVADAVSGNSGGVAPSFMNFSRGSVNILSHWKAIEHSHTNEDETKNLQGFSLPWFSMSEPPVGSKSGKEGAEKGCDCEEGSLECDQSTSEASITAYLKDSLTEEERKMQQGTEGCVMVFMPLFECVDEQWLLLVLDLRQRRFLVYNSLLTKRAPTWTDLVTTAVSALWSLFCIAMVH
ncbi:LOW QUALITY PROTEIN: hypothetical protein Cgig2_028304 [Carnegiea gigantea]|uniref:Uncharacterized protein n=1 Tax=Carnegiea gigantea TaxID=171969 RepID=A0A9Q1JK74_9CARY|nr:LOW QUALITY PROTEIN: hypothetical protein Cgig2_028304 [Carnegiea gigantea]